MEIFQQVRLDQDCPISPIAFLFYNADLIRTVEGEKDRLGLGFIDDIAFLASGSSFVEANRKLQEMMQRDGGALEWSKTHHGEFELGNTVLVCVSCR